MEKNALPTGSSFTDILIRTGPRSQTKFKLLDVIALQASDKYVHIYLVGRDSPLLVQGPLQLMEDKLFPFYFFRTHKSWIIGLHHLLSVEDDSVIVSQRLQVPLSASYRQGLCDRFILFN